MYQVLAYLYKRLKDGKAVETEILEPQSPLLKINDTYWAYIMENMQEQGFIKGVSLKFAMGHVLVSYDLSKTQITPRGIEYLCENSTIKKAYRFLKDSGFGTL